MSCDRIARFHPIYIKFSFHSIYVYVCLFQGVKQTPVYLGRKKREYSTDDDERNTGIEGNMQVVGHIDVLVDAEFDYEELF